MGMEINEDEGEYDLSLECGDLPVDDAIRAAGHEPNGYFWEGVAAFLAPDVAKTVEFDSEGDMFAAYADKAGPLEQLKAVIEPLTTDPTRLTTVLADAHAAGHDLDGYSDD